ncbi:MAG: hypothetical protein JXR86_19635 [Spirochaetales bacterium]|nr:hypothetical protein [Spirochaetales bacterium]
MSQITLRKIPSTLDSQLRALSKANNTSLNVTIQILLMKALGLEADSKKKRDLSGLFGAWSESEAGEFNENTAVFDNVDREIWE